MRKKIAAANWKMNLTLAEGQKLVKAIMTEMDELPVDQAVLFAVPFPYLVPLQSGIDKSGVYLAAQDCSAKNNGAFTGEVSASMLNSIGISYVVIGHSERREYHAETPALLADKVNRALENELIPVF